ncbi:hypothetical protein BJ085DRAFT_18652 [Dimargaris cristalligena]|uniref:Chromatin modification-related protein n=1 Tax=Dimargaris cristalligena TaxID=215637 RepID=A0A4P9ZXH3_9FUNG|nr:hypothetical protein BJ085DRAFT_18652 [Dimargaris cristalligena]|eukprot:RKP37602.1 hypothetical protein BJ085DRAFT_18652 [Dimargaris cristalligena]
MEDIGLYLQDFVSSLDNLPSEIQHYFTELKAHEQEFQQIRRGIHQREKTFQTHLRTHGYAADQIHPQEAQLIAKSHRDFQKAQDIADEKTAIAQRALELVQRHLKRLDGDLKRHEQEEKHQRAGGGGGSMSSALHGYANSAGTSSSTTSTGATDDTNGGAGGAGGSHQNIHIIENIDTAAGIEPDEPLYCICQQVSYGDMVACDGKNCPHEWFHYDCVGLTAPPKGAWYCADCLASRKMVK